MISATLLHIADATDEAIIEDYADGWPGAGACTGHGWFYDPGQGRRQRHRHGPTEAGELERQIADRVPAVREWIATFDRADFLEADEIRILRALLIATGA